MSRSFGDRVAKQVGVTSEPEILSSEITKNSHFLVLGSDGLFEYLNNDDIMKLIIPFYLKNDPDGACNALINDSIKAWKS